MRNKNVLLPTLLLGAAMHNLAVADGVVKQSSPLLGQTSMDCSMPLPAEAARPAIDGAETTLMRTSTGIIAMVKLPTPAPGSYCYPPAILAFDPGAGPAVPGHPEAFSLWGIYFNHPENCLNGQCSAADVLGPNCVNVEAGAVKLGGHIEGGDNLNLAGHLSVGDGPLGPLGCAPLLDSLGAEIHLAVAPHGMLIPSLLPDSIGTPPGGGPGYWFPAIFEGVD
jgi:hypothetical protein